MFAYVFLKPVLGVYVCVSAERPELTALRAFSFLMSQDHKREGQTQGSKGSMTLLGEEDRAEGRGTPGRKCSWFGSGLALAGSGGAAAVRFRF